MFASLLSTVLQVLISAIGIDTKPVVKLFHALQTWWACFIRIQCPECTKPKLPECPTHGILRIGIMHGICGWPNPVPTSPGINPIPPDYCLGFEPVKEGSSGRIRRYFTRTAAMEPIARNLKTTKIVMDGRHGDNRQR